MRRWVEFLPLCLVRWFMLKHGERFSLGGANWAGAGGARGVLFRVSDSALKESAATLQQPDQR